MPETSGPPPGGGPRYLDPFRKALMKAGTLPEMVPSLVGPDEGPSRDLAGKDG